MRQRVVNLHLDHLRVDHDQPQILRREAVEDTREDGVNAHALTRSRRPSHQPVRHGCKVCDDRVPVHILAQRDRDAPFRVHELLALQQLPQRHLLLLRIRDLDAHRVFPRNRRKDVDALRPRRPCDVALVAGDPVHPHTLRRIHFIARDRRAFRDVPTRHRDAKLRQRLDDQPLNPQQFLVIRNLPVAEVRRVQQIEGRKLVVLAMDRAQQLMPLLLLLPLRHRHRHSRIEDLRRRSHRLDGLRREQLRLLITTRRHLLFLILVLHLIILIHRHTLLGQRTLKPLALLG